jgi:hypothetical protein
MTQKCEKCGGIMPSCECSENSGLIIPSYKGRSDFTSPKWETVYAYPSVDGYGGKIPKR